MPETTNETCSEEGHYERRTRTMAQDHPLHNQLSFDVPSKSDIVGNEEIDAQHGESHKSLRTMTEDRRSKILAAGVDGRRDPALIAISDPQD